MTPGRNIVTARWIALLLPAALLAGAWGSQLIGHLYPCELCHWQRWPHYAAVTVAILAFVVPPRSVVPMVALAAVLIAVSGGIGVYHAGTEYHWWAGHTACTTTADLSGGGGGAAQRLAAIMNAPMIRCDEPQWTFHGISLAGFNAVLSLGGAAAIAVLLGRRRA
ncbi:disulfide bond formation protein B [uncultured Sphingomonas sp.]|uniref:disulfide bond formation protein B n=1 Tax=uncultured Sphingomonas sp. TaxID=158754 RepID=UPI0035CAB914